ncbi:MAG: hypothetical protein M1830_005172 [Pleopsidium flavum]|nr:MAG: hypothetical protein M1830_005172 [Pleopsidium flavum]
MSPKRKATAVPSSEVGSPGPKRRRMPEGDVSTKETPDSTAEVGLRFISQLKQACDKRGRPIATSFLALPDKDQIPEYYKEIALPIAIDTVEAKLNRREYPTLTTLESDIKRMVMNAKSFNERNSEVFADAERIRKMLSNYMSKHNIAYKDSNYAAFPTPLPGESGAVDDDVDADGDSDPEEASGRSQRLSTFVGSSSAPTKSADGRTASSTPVIQDAEGAGESFAGDTFQIAQEKIMTELIQVKDDQNQEISLPFLNLPPRQLTDYYRLIKHPVSLKSAQKKVRGIRGRDKPTGVSFFRNWQAFEDEVSFIWRNARDYNEDGSDISKLAGQVETFFRRRLAEARKVVSEPPQQKVKLKMSAAKSPEPMQPKITLRVGGQKSSPALTPNTSAGLTVDNEALQRQKDLVKAGANGQGTSTAEVASSRAGSRNPFGAIQSGSASTPVPSLGHPSLDINRSSSAASPSPSAIGVKSEVQLGQSPALGAVQARRSSNGSNEAPQTPHLAASAMPPPPSVTPHPPSGSPHPQGQSHTSYTAHHATTNAFDSRWRQPGKGWLLTIDMTSEALIELDASDALISNLSISTHPGLKIDHHFHLDVPPSSTQSQQSITINLPSTHYYLRVVPTIAHNLSHRPSKLFVTANVQRLNPTPQRPEEADPRQPLYETKVFPGVNRIEVEMIAGPPRGAPKSGAGQDVELEKITIFANVLKA